MRLQSIYLITTVCLLSLQCRQRYEVVVKQEETSLLVVQGFINASGATQFTLSRTVLLSDSIMHYEQGAVVAIESENNDLYVCTALDSGKYRSDLFMLDPNTRYRLIIQTTNAKHYQSDWRPVLQTPLIDTISFTRFLGGVNINVHAFDPTNQIKYYKFNYEEDWEYHSAYRSYKGMRRDHTKPPESQISLYWLDSTNFSWAEYLYICYDKRKSSSIELATTEHVQPNQLYHTLIHYPQGAVECSVLYSALIHMQALSKEGYTFYDIMRKNTESLGTIFDALPTELKGNIHCLENEQERVIGFVEASTITSRRVFIDSTQLPEWNYDSGCEPNYFYENLYSHVWKAGRLPTTPASNGTFAADSICVDCRLRGGTNNKPSFWPR